MNTPMDILQDKRMADLFAAVAESQKNDLRHCKTLLAGFKATKEKDTGYMDGFMDRLLDFMDPGSDVESLYRKYIAHISKFAPEEAKGRLEHLEYDLGYWSPVVYAAYIIAYELRDVHLDKDGKAKLQSHLLDVGTKGYGWKEKVAGLLYATADGLEFSETELTEKVKAQLQNFADNLSSIVWEDIIPYEAVLELCPYPGQSIFFPSDEAWAEIEEALRILRSDSTGTREEYLMRFKTNILALKVKINSLKANMDSDKSEYTKLLGFLDDWVKECQ